MSKDKTQTERAENLGITQGALSKFESALKERGYGTKAQRKYAKEKRLRIIAIPID